MNPFSVVAWTWNRIFFPVGQNILIDRTTDFLRHPHRYYRPVQRGRRGNGFNQFRNELDMDESDDAMVTNEDLRIDEDAENLSAEAVGHPEDLFPNSFQLDQFVNIDEKMNDQADSLTGETVGNIDEMHTPPFPFWDAAEPTTETEAVGGHFFDTVDGELNSNPETLSPLNLDSALVTDAYQQQDAPGADLIAGEANQGMHPYQAQREQYEVLA